MDRVVRSVLGFIANHWLLIFSLPVLAVVIFSVLTPYFAAKGFRIAGYLYSFYSNFCHQLARRSFFLFGNKMAFCSRDFALYASFLVGSALWAATKKRLSLKYWLLFLIPIAVDASTQNFGLRESTNLLRVITGSLAGGSTAFFIWPYFEKAFGKVKEELK